MERSRGQSQGVGVKQPWRYTAGALLLVLLAACGPTAQEKQVIADLTADMKSACVGRFTMDVPQDMTLFGGVKLYYGLDKNFKTVDVDIESLDSTPEKMKAQLDQAAEKIDKGDLNWETKKSMLLAYRVVDDHMIYLRKLSALESADGSDHELHLLVGKTQLLLSADSYEGVPDAGVYEPDGKVETPEEVSDRLFKIAGQIRAYDDAEKAGPGFCLGPVVIDSDQDEESGTTYFFMDKHPDLLLRVYSKALTPDQPDQQLAKRVALIDGRSDVHVLRNESRTVGGMKAHEWIAKTTDDHDDTLLAFAAESMRPNPALVRPYLSINLDTGGRINRGADAGKYVSSSLTSAEGMALWDAIIHSIRARPNSVKHVSQK